MELNNNQQVFIALVKAGLWEKEVRLSQYGKLDFNEILRLSEEQSVVGLVAAGLEHIVDRKAPQESILQFIGWTIRIEQRNIAMNRFIELLVGKMQAMGIFILLMKGQGIAQCYERPLWRSPGDIDYYLNKDNYEKAKRLLLPMSTAHKTERIYSKEMGMFIDSWFVEIHGTQRTGLSKRLDCEIDDIQKDIFFGNNVRSWENGGETILLPAPDYDVIIVFTHFIKHFYKGRMNLRQVCDWCRLLWTFRDTLNKELLESQIRKMRLMSEWKVFAALAVDSLGMPAESMPLYSANTHYTKKARQILCFILRGGEKKRIRDTLKDAKIFPISTLRFVPGILFNVNLLKIKERLFE